jgi:hypothetical protein
MKKMTATEVISVAVSTSVDPDMHRLEMSLRRWTAGLLISAVLGGLTGLTGLGIGALSILGVAHETSVVTLGTLSIALSFPLLILAAHCLDKVDACDKAIRLERCRKTGFKDGDDR